MKNSIEKDYPLIPMDQITEEARLIAVRWMECDDKNWIGHKHKLASDIMNYARRVCAEEKNELLHEVSQYKLREKQIQSMSSMRTAIKFWDDLKEKIKTLEAEILDLKEKK